MRQDFHISLPDWLYTQPVIGIDFDRLSLAAGCLKG